MVSLANVLARANGLIRFTYTADATDYFRVTNKYAGGPRRDERFPDGITKISDVVATLTLNQNYEREIMASALRQGIAPELVTDLVRFAANGLSGMTWHPDHVGLIVLNSAGKHALRCYPASGTANYGIAPARYINNATGLELTADELEPWTGAPKKPALLRINGVLMATATGEPIKKIVPHYYFLDGMSDLRNV